MVGGGVMLSVRALADEELRGYRVDCAVHDGPPFSERHRVCVGVGGFLLRRETPHESRASAER